MELYAKGQLSYLILTCLQDRDFYGLDIISEISSRSNGKINLKKPSVYSNLTRMEKQGYVSSYLQSSDFGPNRKYYSLTDKGRGFYQELKAYFDYNNIDVFRDFNDIDVVSDNFLNSYDKEVTAVITEVQGQSLNSVNLHNESQTLESSVNETDNINEIENEEQDDFFDFSSLEEEQKSDEIYTQVSNNAVKTVNEIASENELQANNEEFNTYSDAQELHDETNDNSDFNKETETLVLTQSEDLNSEHILQEASPAQFKDNNENEQRADDARFLIREEIEEKSENIDEGIIAANKSFSMSEAEIDIKEENLQSEISVKQDDAVFLPNENVDEYNKRLFDISKDINKIKRKRSFAEDQISIAATDPLPIANEKKKANIEEFKNSLLENKNRYTYNNINFETRSNLNSLVTKSEEKKPLKEEKKEVKDDAVLVTGHLTPDDVGQAKKIAPPRIKIVSENTKDTRLPAPKRDTNVDPSHREILNRLYSKTKDSASVEARPDAIYDYNDLKDFYESQSISFNVYHKSAESKKHNTNLIYLAISISTLLISLLCSTLLYVIFLKTGMLNANTNFMFILLPALLIFDVALKAYNYKTYTSWLPSKLSPQWKIWCFYFLVSCIVVGLNLICGIATKEFSLFATTLILPLILAFVLIPFRYYFKRIVLVKYWK